MTKKSIKNYQSDSLFLIFGKSFERLLYKTIFSFFIEKDLFSQNQSDMKFYKMKSYDVKWKVRGVFLDISKTFDKVWH